MLGVFGKTRYSVHVCSQEDVDILIDIYEEYGYNTDNMRNLWTTYPYLIIDPMQKDIGGNLQRYSDDRFDLYEFHEWLNLLPSDATFEQYECDLDILFGGE